MLDAFRPFSELLTRRPEEPPACGEPAGLEPPALEPPACACSDDALREVRLFEACVREGVAQAVETITADIAAVVLARELQLQPPHIARIVDRACARFFSDNPVRVRLHPADARTADLPVPIIQDDTLRAGDAVLELQSGHVDATLGTRFASLLAGLAR
jgi:flagellar biosynthesis/type III secretory pathway protein FliH